MQSLMEIRAEKAAFTFCGINCGEVPFQGPAFFEVVAFWPRGSSGRCEQLSIGQGRRTRWQGHQHRVSDWFPEGGR